ncbi:hypothetical protein L1N85_11495 [Paenibacillus alkaliterrae]|uniref:hypothetical protein n=1 Tax=Paenibacillus alkaliterrae TaxID=320909 RepID=UPI001F1E30DD|nr:hypothetical protein [Paenibacillus alkaliterrae]MCF2939059.1 hypothetical protein [Paenibacillus alkaliterrae]
MRVNLYADGAIRKSYTLGEAIVTNAGSEKQVEALKGLRQVGKVIIMAGGTLGLLLPKMVFAAGIDGTFGNVHSAIMNAFDAGIVLVIIFAGASWALGHRTKAIEILIGVCCGYILARHAIDIRDFLKGI